MTETLSRREIGADRARRDGPAKVTGTAPYAAEHPFDRPLYAGLTQAAVARGRVASIDTAAARATPGVVTVLTHENAEKLEAGSGDLAVLQDLTVSYRGQIVAIVVADTLEAAREAAGRVRVTYDAQRPDVDLRADRDDLYAPAQVNPAYPTDVEHGDVASGLAAADHVVDEVYTTPLHHHVPLELHTTVARWDPRASHLHLHHSTQGPHWDRALLAPVFSLDEEQISVVAQYVGGGFGSKIANPSMVAAVLAARAVPDRPVKLALTRQMTFTVVAHRPRSVQRVRLGARADGRLLVVTHDVVSETSHTAEYAEQTAVPVRSLYAAPARRTTHRLATLDLPSGTVMRAPGEMPGMFAVESAMDELATALGHDPVELRIRNDPETDPETGLPFSSRNLAACLREGARRFGWADRDPAPRRRRAGRHLLGTGVAASTYPTYRTAGPGLPASEAEVEALPDGRYRISIDAVDIGTGAWTALAQVAADALGVGFEQVEMAIGHSDLPYGGPAGGSSGLGNWGTTIFAAARAFRDAHGHDPAPGSRVTGSAGTPTGSGMRGMVVEPDRFAMHAYGAQFAEVRVDVDTGEVRVSRLLGVFAAGRILNPRTARSQLLGGMTMGLSSALHEAGVLDADEGQIVNHDLASYHVASHADVPSVEATWIEEDDPHVNPMGTKGIGEIGIVGTAAAIANAVHHATGTRIRDLPITPDKLLLTDL